MHIQCACPNLVVETAFGQSIFGQSIFGQNLGFTICAAPKGGSAFFPSPAPIFVLFVSLWLSSRGILVVFEAPGDWNVNVWCSRLVVWSPGGPEGQSRSWTNMVPLLFAAQVEVHEMTWKCFDFLVLYFPKALLKYFYQPNSLWISVPNHSVDSGNGFPRSSPLVLPLLSGIWFSTCLLISNMESCDEFVEKQMKT